MKRPHLATVVQRLRLASGHVVLEPLEVRFLVMHLDELRTQVARFMRGAKPRCIDCRDTGVVWRREQVWGVSKSGHDAVHVTTKKERCTCGAGDDA